MAVISITITNSTLQLVAGIPRTVALATNIPATIFYTLDGTTPTTSSLVYTSPILMPTDENTVVLQAFATDGMDTSAIIFQSYGTTIVGDRLPRSTVLNLPSQIQRYGPGLFGSGNQLSTGAIYGEVGGTIVDAAGSVGIPDGYDGFGGISNKTDLPYPDNYEVLFSETNDIGLMGRGIGTLPAVDVIVPPPPNQENSVGGGSPDTNSPFFNPKSLVIYQDSTKEPYDPSVPVINRPYFSLENPTTARNGALLFTSAYEGNNGVGGSALKQQYNPRDNTITYYYRDQNTNRWIISKTAYTPKNSDIGNYSKIVFGREQGIGRVFKWIPFRYRTLW